MKDKIKTKLFLDSVIMDEIRKFSWIITGVTTTPTFFKREGVNYDKFVADFRKIFPNLELHIESLGPTAGETESQLQQFLKKDWYDPSKVVIKIPADFDNLKIIAKYSKQNVRFNTHLIFSPAQAYLAVSAGTTYVCPLIGRYADNMSKQYGNNLRGGENDIGKKLLKDIITVLNNISKDNPAKIMASSIRTIEDFENSIALGVDVVTVPTKILETSIIHEYTTAGIKTFLADMGF